MTLPPLKLHPAPEAQKRRYGRWLTEWEIDRDLRSIHADGPSSAPEAPSSEFPATSALSEEPEPAIGQVRLFSPRIGPARERLFYVALLECIDQRFFAAAPFSRFSEPCLTGELSTNRAAPCLRTICLWNTLRASRELLANSWVVDELSSQELADATAVLRHTGQGSALPCELTERTGPPRWHPADPRNLYVEEETSFVTALLSGSPGGSLIEYPEKDISWPIAAEPGSEYRTRSDETPPPDTKQ